MSVCQVIQEHTVKQVLLICDTSAVFSLHICVELLIMKRIVFCSAQSTFILVYAVIQIISYVLEMNIVSL